MKIFSDFKRILRDAKIKYTIMSSKPGWRQLMVEFRKDKVTLTQGQYSFRNVCNIIFQPDYYVSIQSVNHALNQTTSSGIKRSLSVSVFCFDCQELVKKLKLMGYISTLDAEKIDLVTKEGYGYKRKKAKKKTRSKKTPAPTLFDQTQSS